jgi:hypothetical protein
MDAEHSSEKLLDFWWIYGSVFLQKVGEIWPNYEALTSQKKEFLKYGHAWQMTWLDKWILPEISQRRKRKY